MNNDLIHKIYDFVNHIIHSNDSGHYFQKATPNQPSKKCPITDLDISMQPKNSKFLSMSGVKWYYNNDKRTYDLMLVQRLTENCKRKDINSQFRAIAHSIRNSDSNPRNNTRKAIQKLLKDKDCLFNNLSLIDKNKILEAQINLDTGQE